MIIFHDTLYMNSKLVWFSKFRWIVYFLAIMCVIAADSIQYERYLLIIYTLIMVFLGLIYKSIIVIIFQSCILTLVRCLFNPESVPFQETFFLSWFTYFTIGFAISTLVNNYINQQKLNLQLTRSFSKLLDLRDPYTAQHSENVAKYAKIIAKKMGLTEKSCHLIYMGGLLHDIGKITIPEKILNKPSKLTEDEYAFIKNHPSIGYSTLKELTSLDKGVLDVILYHHERYDGFGYPSGLKADEIPLYARITAVADAFDALTSKRIYRDKIDLDLVLDELKIGKGRQFDPVIIEIFIEYIEKNKKELLKSQKHNLITER